MNFIAVTATTLLTIAMRRRSSVRIRTRKVIGRITYEPEKHKQKFIKSLRRDLASRPPDKPKKSPTPDTSLTFGSLNVNGLSQESHWAVTQLMKTHQIDVSKILRDICDSCSNLRS